jgi:hypothetical protein
MMKACSQGNIIYYWINSPTLLRKMLFFISIKLRRPACGRQERNVCSNRSGGSVNYLNLRNKFRGGFKNNIQLASKNILIRYTVACGREIH